MNDSIKSLNIFLSYSWADKETADKIERDLRQLQINIVRDVRDIKYKGHISDFMEQIRVTDFAILLISDSYLKSKNCMSEVLHLLRERDYETKLLPVIAGNVKIYDPMSRLDYTAYWKVKKEELAQAIFKYSPTSAISAITDLQVVESIYSGMNEFLGYIADLKNITFDELKHEGYRSLLESIGVKDITFLVDLLTISFEDELEKRELLLEEWFENYTPISPAYSMRADIAKAKSQFDRAERNFKRALELDSTNAIAMNNYGYMLMNLDKEREEARRLFERAVEIAPQFTEARLNLGVLLFHKFADKEGAKAQYEEVIRYNPIEEKAYNNLANILKSESQPTEETKVKICSLYEKALQLNGEYKEAIINYANFLSEVVFDFDKAEALLLRLMKFAPETRSYP